MLYSKELEIKYDIDVFVAGGGAAGVAAAVAAARQGKSDFTERNVGCQEKDGEMDTFSIFLFTDCGVSAIINRTMQTLRNEWFCYEY